MRCQLSDYDYEFKKELFLKFVTLGKVFILLDGFDEVNVDLQDDVRLAIEDLSRKCCGSRLMLTTRPQNSIPDLSGGSQFHFKKLTPEQVNSIIHRYDAVSGANLGEELINQLTLVPNTLKENPLLVSLIYRVFAVNKNIAGHITNFFDDTYKALYEGHDLLKPGRLNRVKESSLSIDDFRRLLRAHAYRSVVKQEFSWSDEQDIISSIEEASALCLQDKSVSETFLKDLLCAVPLLVREGR